MAWESGIAYNASLADAVREALESQSVAWLSEALANDKYARIFTGAYNAKHARAFDRWVSQFSKLAHDTLVELCMDCATRTDTCANGGNPVWIDKGGCSVIELE